MNDRELLELAAKAAKYEVRGYDEVSGYLIVFDPARPSYRALYWGPQHDDGDALRLAVKLRMNIVITTLGPYARSEDAPSNWVDENCTAGDDYAAATRRVIVRAAAEIGKQ